MRIDGNDQRLAAATAVQMQQSGVQQVLAPKWSQQQDASIKALVGDTVSIKVDLPQNTVDILKRIGSASDILNSLATNLRQSNEGLSAANAVTAKMKASLDKVVKDYPPFSLDDSGRMEQLMDYASLRKQLQSMMIPAPPQPVYEKVKHLWEGLTGGTGGTVQVPSLPHDAPDTHVRAALQQLDGISSQMTLVQETMANLVMKA